MKAKAAAFSSKGIRAHNEDSFLLGVQIGGTGMDDSFAEYEGELDGITVFAVIDGMGGHAAGDVASAFAASEVRESVATLNRNGTVLSGDTAEKILLDAHTKLLEKGRADGTPGMGCTWTGIFCAEDVCGFCNVGDSRTYRLRGGFLQQLSKDDSLCSVVPDAPKNILTQAMGGGIEKITVQSRFSASVAVSGDVFLMCSDGVHGHVSDDDLSDMMNAEESEEEKAKRIVSTAISNGSDDNATAVIVKMN